MADAAPARRSWQHLLIAAPGFLALILGIGVFIQLNRNRYKAPPIARIELSAPLEIEATLTTGGSGGDTSTWAHGRSTANEPLPSAHELLKVQLVGRGWHDAERDCGGDSPPCRAPQGVVLTDRHGTYLYLHSTPPEGLPELAGPVSPRDARIALIYEQYGLGRFQCCSIG